MSFVVGPAIITNPSSINITTDVDSITLICEATGIPIPTITWIHNGNVLDENGSGSGYVYRNVSINAMSIGPGTLRSVLTTLAKDTGPYRCIATSPVSYYDPVVSETAIVSIVVGGKSKDDNTNNLYNSCKVCVFLVTKFTVHVLSSRLI